MRPFLLFLNQNARELLCLHQSKEAPTSCSMSLLGRTWHFSPTEQGRHRAGRGSGNGVSGIRDRGAGSRAGRHSVQAGWAAYPGFCGGASSTKHGGASTGIAAERHRWPFLTRWRFNGTKTPTLLSGKEISHLRNHREVTEVELLMAPTIPILMFNISASTLR